MIYKRYKDADKLIVDADGLKLSDDALVLIYHEDKWYDDVLMDLEGQTVSFEKLKPYIIFAAKNLVEMDVIAQKYSALHGDGRFVDGYEVTYVFLDVPDRIRLRYCGINQNSEFDVVFQYIDGGFSLKSFGMKKDIPSNWATLNM